MKKVGLRMDGL
jgi:hypothetical protein